MVKCSRADMPLESCEPHGCWPGHQLTSADDTAASSISGSTPRGDPSFPHQGQAARAGLSPELPLCHGTGSRSNGLHLGAQAQPAVLPRQLSRPTCTKGIPRSKRAAPLLPQGAPAMSAHASLRGDRRQYPGIEEVASEPVLPRHHPLRLWDR